MARSTSRADVDDRFSATANLSGKPVGAVTNAVAIIRYLNEKKAPLGLSQIAQKLGLHSSTCFNILRTLAREGLVYFDTEAKLYSIGLGMLELSRSASLQIGDIYAVRPFMSALAREEAVTVTIWRRTAPQRMLLVVGALSSSNVRIQITVGHSLPIAAGSVGRAMCAFSDVTATQMREAYRTVRWNAGPSFEQFKAQVEEARANGFSVDDGQFITGMCSLAVPVLVPDRPMVMACSALMFAGQDSPAKRATVVARLQEISGMLSRAAEEE